MRVRVSRVGLWGSDTIVSVPQNPLLRSGASRAGSDMPCCWAVKRRTIQREVPSVFGFRVKSRLLLHASLPEILSRLFSRPGDTCPSPFVFGPCGAARCGDESMHVLGHLRCPGESTQSREPISFGRIERGSISSKDNLSPCDPSRPSPSSSHPSTSIVPSVVAPIVLDGAFPVNLCSS